MHPILRLTHCIRGGSLRISAKLEFEAEWIRMFTSTENRLGYNKSNIYLFICCFSAGVCLGKDRANKRQISPLIPCLLQSNITLGVQFYLRGN